MRTSTEKFLGTWILDTATCQYEQGDPPQSGSYKIEEDGDELVFHMAWVDSEGDAQDMSFRGKPDGVPVPFNGGPLADALSITALSDTELDSAAFMQGAKLMVAERKLSADGQSMTITQTVHLPDGSAPSNVAVYRKVH